MDSADFGDIRLWRNAKCRPAGESSPLGIVSTVLFRFAGAYRDVTKYARGLSLLSSAVSSLLPGFVLRVYCDASVDPRTLRAAGLRADADAIEAALGSVAAEGGEIVWFRSASCADGAGGHRDLYGTMIRYLPLFDNGGTDLPSWAGGPPDGTVVLVTDADYSDFSVERAMLALGAWLGDKRHGDSGYPDLAALTTGASAAPRHAPAAGLPPFIANCLTTRTRLPLNWLRDFLRDAGIPGRGSLAGRYADDVHDARSRNFTYEKRKIAAQTSRFPFGIDEFFLSAVIKPRSIAGSQQRSWLFLVVPSLDIIERKALGLLSAGCERATAAHCGGQAERVRLAAAAAALAGVPMDSHATDDVSLKRLADNWAREYPALASARSGGWARASGPLHFCDSAAMAGPARDLRELWASLTDALSAGAVPSDGAEDLEYALQGSASAASVAPHLIGALLFSVGGGDVVCKGANTPVSADLLAHLSAIRAEALRTAPSPPGAFESVVLDQVAYQEARGAAALQAANASDPSRKRARDARDAGAASSAPVAASLPEGWTLLESKSTGRSYYFHAATNASSWTRPER